MVTSTIALLFFFFRFSDYEQGSGARGKMSCGIQGTFCPSIRPSVRPSFSPSVCPSIRLSIRLFVRSSILCTGHRPSGAAAQKGEEEEEELYVVELYVVELYVVELYVGYNGCSFG